MWGGQARPLLHSIKRAVSLSLLEMRHGNQPKKNPINKAEKAADSCCLAAGRASDQCRVGRRGWIVTSPCLRRVRALERAAVIRGYHASLDRTGLSLGLMVFVSVKIERHQDASAVAFRETVAMLPYVISCHLVSGEADLFLQVVVPDLAA